MDPLPYRLVMLNEIYVPPGRMRSLNPEVVERLKQSIAQIGFKTPISVRDTEDGDGCYCLVTGMHRYYAAKELGFQDIPIRMEQGNEIDARLWEIRENLDRAELTVLERSEHIAELLRLTNGLPAQLAPAVLPDGRRAGPQHQPKGINAAVREQDIDRTEAQRAVKIDKLSPEAKDKAKELHLDDNQSALMKAVREAAPLDQLRVIEEHFAQIHAPRPPAPHPQAADPLNDFETIEKQVGSLMSAWNRAGPEARERFLTAIDTPVFDRTASNR